MALEIIKLDKKTSDKFLQALNVSGKGMCQKLEGIYIDGELCPGAYKVSDKLLGRGNFGSVYQSCLQGRDCQYVAKWQKTNNKGNNIQDMIDEANYQIQASKLGLAPRIREVWQCSDGMITIIDALSQSLDRVMLELTPTQYKEWERSISKILTKKEIEQLKGGGDQQWIEMFKKHKEEFKGGIITPDSPEVQRERKRLVVESFEVIKKLHVEAEITHGDIRMGNLMIDKKGKVFLIDFGNAFPYTSAKSANNDFEEIETSFSTYVYYYGFNNLQYLFDFTNKIKKDYFHRKR